MDRSRLFPLAIRLLGVAGLAAGILGGYSLGQTPPPPPVGGPLRDLTSGELAAWQAGQQTFSELEAPAEGLGPVFNARTCGACHRAGALGGASVDNTISRVTRIGGFVNGAYSDLQLVGGPVIEVRSLREVDQTYPFPGEHVPVGAFVSRRMTTPTFGDGLIEAIPWTTLRDRSQMTFPDGIHGVANWVINPETNSWQIGRFGWKAQVPTLHTFAGDAYLNEVGITSKFFPKDNAPQGNTDPSGADKVTDPEDGTNDVGKVANFMRFTAPPPPVPLDTLAVAGQQLFANMNCAVCHVPAMQTGTSFSASLTNKTVRLYSDLLVHHMGAALSDGVRQGSAMGDQWRTAPLWGLRFRTFFLHDGRATTANDAILMHGGEAQAARDRYANLSTADKSAVLDFLSRI